MDEDTTFSLDIEQLVFVDTDSLSKDIILEVTQGKHFTFDKLAIISTANFNGEISVPVTLFDGRHRSTNFDLKITVNEIKHAHYQLIKKLDANILSIADVGDSQLLFEKLISQQKEIVMIE